MRYDFTIELDGQVYRCWRETDGTRVLQQRVHVLGIGEAYDHNQYENGAVQPMDTTAKRIAGEIIRNHLRREEIQRKSSAA